MSGYWDSCCSKQNKAVCHSHSETLLHHAASLTAVLKSRRPRGRSAPSLWLFECRSAAPCCTHNPFNDRPLRCYGWADVSAARWGKQHQRDWFFLMGHFIMEANVAGRARPRWTWRERERTDRWGQWRSINDELYYIWEKTSCSIDLVVVFLLPWQQEINTDTKSWKM